MSRDRSIDQGSTKLLPFALILLLGVTVPFLLGIMQSTLSVPSTGLIKAINVGVYSDSGCITPLSNLTWGTLEPGSSENRTIYVKNMGNSALTLSLITENWSPTNASDYLDLTWSLNGTILNEGASIQAELTLTVSTEISGVQNFNFDIVIIGTG